MNKEYKEKILKTGLEGFLIGVIQGCLRAHKQQSIVGSILESMLILIGFEFVDAFFTKNIDWIDISAACLGGFLAQVRKSVDSPPGMLTEDHHHTVHEESQVCYSSHLRPKSLHL